MSERIKEILYKCTDPTMAKPWPLINAEKFAELIIQECMSVVKDINQEYDGGSTVVNAAEEIKEHFKI